MIRVATQKTWGWAETDTRNLGGLSPASPAGSRFSLPGVGTQPQSQEITVPGEKSQGDESSLSDQKMSSGTVSTEGFLSTSVRLLKHPKGTSTSLTITTINFSLHNKEEKTSLPIDFLLHFICISLMSCSLAILCHIVPFLSALWRIPSTTHLDPPQIPFGSVHRPLPPQPPTATSFCVPLILIICSCDLLLRLALELLELPQTYPHTQSYRSGSAWELTPHPSPPPSHD